MRVTGFTKAPVVLSFWLLSTGWCLVAEVNIQTGGSKVTLSWPASIVVPNQGTVWPEYTISRSSDLSHWTPVGGRISGIPGRSGAVLNLALDQQPGPGFFRIVAGPNVASGTQLGDGGEEVFGYARKFNEELNRIGLLSLEDFATNAPQPTYLPRLTWDPTTAAFWTNFYTNAVFRLNSAELELFTNNGFVVSERLGSHSFGGMYYSVFHGDLPVFITADSIMQAWHRTYLNMLEELEELELATLMEKVITNMSRELPSVWAAYGNGPLRQSILDADYFLTVARSLWAGAQVDPALPVAGQGEHVALTLSDIASLQLRESPLFGDIRRWVDFSQFKVRGHYANSERLKRYFRTMMWCGRTDLRLATFPPNEEDDIRQLGTALVLHELLKQANQFGNWSAIERVTRAFVGVTDSMTFAQMSDLLTHAGIASLADVPDLATLTNLQTRLLTGELGTQSILSDKLFSPLNPEELKLPRSFTFFGQKFVVDSWAFSQVVYDRIHWPSTNNVPGCGTTNLLGKVMRRKPTALDVAFSVLGNDQVAPEIIERISRTNGVPFRDGLPYQHNLLAVRNVVANQEEGAWTDNIYNAWLAALRALSTPTTGLEYPQAMRTRAWAMKTVNTQLASWTELRHDTILYAKQSYSAGVICSYPYGFVEPLPEFWRKMSRLAITAYSAISQLPTAMGGVSVEGRGTMPFPNVISCDLEAVKRGQLAALSNFSTTMLKLESVALNELAQRPLTASQNEFLISTMEYLGICHSGPLGYTGWYPALFYENVFASSLSTENWEFHQLQGCAMNDALVTDVHTDVSAEVVCDPGAVIHEGVRKPHLLLIAVDNGPDRMVYAGPVFSHYEFEMPGTTRLSDEEWKYGTMKPPSPEWTRSFLVTYP